MSWLFQVLDSLLGQQAFILTSFERSPRSDIDFYAVLFTTGKNITIVSAAFNPDIDQRGTAGSDRDPRLARQESTGPRKVRYTKLAQEDTPGYALKQMIQNGEIPGVKVNPPFDTRPDLVGQFHEMISAAAAHENRPQALQRI